MATYRTPGVYVEEISVFPPSVAEVATAIPAFIGYTGAGAGSKVAPRIERIDTLLDYQRYFGAAPPSPYVVQTESVDQGPATIVGLTRSLNGADYSLFYALGLYFKNGGGRCYVVSVVGYGDTPSKDDFAAGLVALEKEDEPTLIVMPDAVLLGPADYLDLCQQALSHCGKMGDRFAILDVRAGEGIADPIGAFRDGTGTADLAYGAAYHPYLVTTTSYDYAEGAVTISGGVSSAGPRWSGTFGDSGISVGFSGPDGDAPRVQITAGEGGSDIEFEIGDRRLTVSNTSGKTGSAAASAWATWSAANGDGGFSVTANGGGAGSVDATGSRVVALDRLTDTSANMESIRDDQTALYNAIKTALSGQRVVLPPSAAIAGVYARVDRDRGVWKAPANVSLAGVIAPVTRITDGQQEGMNIHPDSGKSINAIRQFTGKGTLVWGARTLAGNDNEWRYINVRRLFNTIEESAQKASAFAVFEPNDTSTWLKVKAMIEAYLYGLWEQGALAGPTAEQAYFVNVGLGATMTEDDVLNGRMIVEIGIAAVRPAEFVVLRFMQRTQSA